VEDLTGVMKIAVSIPLLNFLGMFIVGDRTLNILGSLLLDSGVLGSRVVREAELLFRAMDK
jgi:hypothetical protein